MLSRSRSIAGPEHQKRCRDSAIRPNFHDDTSKRAPSRYALSILPGGGAQIGPYVVDWVRRFMISQRQSPRVDCSAYVGLLRPQLPEAAESAIADPRVSSRSRTIALRRRKAPRPPPWSGRAAVHHRPQPAHPLTQRLRRDTDLVRYRPHRGPLRPIVGRCLEHHPEPPSPSAPASTCSNLT